MSRLHDLIQQLCPNGVPYKTLGEVVDYEQPGKYLVRSTNYDDRFQTPVLTAGQTFVLGYTDEQDGIYPASKDNPVIIFDDFTGAFKWVDFPFKAKSSAMKMLHADERIILLRYVYFWMAQRNFTSNEHKRLWIGHYSSFRIPVPPRAVQEEIARILDRFTALEAELEAELEARRKQYEYYRDQLLTFGDEVEWKPLGEICKDILAGGDLPLKYQKGQTVPSKEFPYPIYSNGSGNNALYGFSDSYRIKEKAVTISARGTIGYHAVREANFTPIVRLVVLIPIPQLISVDYLNYILDMTDIGHSGGSIPQLTVPCVKKIRIPVPPLAEQERIVAILDKFDALVNDISSGLPAELEMRRKQYEYYRDKLLTFKPIAKEA